MRGIVAAMALRFVACAGVLLGALMMGDASSGLAGADSGAVSPAGGDDQFSKGVNNDGVGAETTLAGVAGEPEPQAASSAGLSDPPDSRVGSGREPGSPASSTPRPDSEGPGHKGKLDKGSNGIVLVPVPFLEGIALPVPAVPNGRGGDLAQDTARAMSTFEVAVTPYLPTPPEPTPSPSFRGQLEEEPMPVSASGGGGSDATAFGGVADLPVLEAPVVVAPRLAGTAVGSPAPASGTRGTPTPPMAGAQATAGGSSNPAVRMREAQPESPPAGTAVPLGTQPQRLGYADYLRTAGLPGLFGAALPGLAGIMLFTLSGTAIGYRQAKTGRVVRMNPAARFLR
jgi:hypothetical protein